MAQLDLGKLLRLQGMVNAAAQVEPSGETGAALTEAYNTLHLETGELVKDIPALSAECRRLFVVLEGPPPFHVASSQTVFQQKAAAGNALTKIRMLGGWIEGIIHEQTFEQRMKFEAEAKAREEAKPPTGFARGQD